MAVEWVEIGHCRLALGDCRDVLRSLGRNPAASVITDPPYSSGGFQESAKSGGSLTGRHKARGESIAFDNLSTRGYGRLMRVMLSAVDADEFYIFTDWKMWISTFDAMEDAGIRVRSMLVWDKEFPGMGLGWRSQHELIAYGKRSPAAVRPGSTGNVLRERRSGNEFHPTEKPLSLMRRLVQATAEDGTVLDPFMGSGSTGVACVSEGRPFIGIERDPTHFATARSRIRRAVSESRSRLPLEVA